MPNVTLPFKPGTEVYTPGDFVLSDGSTVSFNGRETTACEMIGMTKDGFSFFLRVSGRVKLEEPIKASRRGKTMIVEKNLSNLLPIVSVQGVLKAISKDEDGKKWYHADLEFVKMKEATPVGDATPAQTELAHALGDRVAIHSSDSRSEEKTDDTW